MLNPKWYEGMLSHGYEGVPELSKRLVNIMGCIGVNLRLKFLINVAFRRSLDPPKSP